MRTYLFALSLVVGCATPAILVDPGGPQAPTWATAACGPQPRMCDALGTSCCGRDEICGGAPEAVGCPVDSCCPVGPMGSGLDERAIRLQHHKPE